VSEIKEQLTVPNGRPLKFADFLYVPLAVIILIY